jgi:hypothetical protein
MMDGVGASQAHRTRYTDSQFNFRLYAKARILGYTRGKRNQKPTTSLVQIEGVANKEEADFYLGKVRLHSLFSTAIAASFASIPY